MLFLGFVLVFKMISMLRVLNTVLIFTCILLTHTQNSAVHGSETTTNDCRLFSLDCPWTFLCFFFFLFFNESSNRGGKNYNCSRPSTPPTHPQPGPLMALGPLWGPVRTKQNQTEKTAFSLDWHVSQSETEAVITVMMVPPPAVAKTRLPAGFLTTLALLCNQCLPSLALGRYMHTHMLKSLDTNKNA